MKLSQAQMKRIMANAAEERDISIFQGIRNTIRNIFVCTATGSDLIATFGTIEKGITAESYAMRRMNEVNQELEEESKK